MEVYILIKNGKLYVDDKGIRNYKTLNRARASLKEMKKRKNLEGVEVGVFSLIGTESCSIESFDDYLKKISQENLSDPLRK